MVGVWIEPVTAQVMMILLSDLAAIVALPPGITHDWTSSGAMLCGHLRPSASAAAVATAASQSARRKSPRCLSAPPASRQSRRLRASADKGCRDRRASVAARKYERADDRPFDPADATNHGDENHERGPVV